MLHTVKFERMTCVGATLETGDNIIVWGQHIDNYTLAFVAPLKSKKDIYSNSFRTQSHTLFTVQIYIFFSKHAQKI